VICEPAVYDRTMGLFRSRRRKNRDKAAAEHLEEQTTTAELPDRVPVREVTAEQRPDPDRPGWGRTIGQEIGKARDEHPG
jgi:hypothetical protein